MRSNIVWKTQKKIIIGLLGIIALLAIYISTTSTSDSKEKILVSSDQEVGKINVPLAWKDLSQEDILNTAAAGKADYIEGLRFSQSVDLTGDGVDEGIFTGNGGNNDTSVILMKNKGGSVSLAREKGKDGRTSLVSLVSLGRAAVASSFEILPQEKGYYRKSSSWNMDRNIFVCDQDGLDAYTWDASENLFKWDQAMTEKYTTQVCL